MESDLGLTPSNDGKLIRLPIPQLTEDRRKELVKVVRNYAEEGRVAVRNVRRDVMHHLKELVTNGDVGATRSGGPRSGRRSSPTSTTKAIDEALKHKEAEIMEVSASVSSTVLAESEHAPPDGHARAAGPSCPRSRAPSRSSWTATAAGRAAAGCPSRPGHRAGTRALRRTVEAAIDLGVGRSPCTPSRPRTGRGRADEVDALMEMFAETIERELPDLAKQGVRTRFIGRRDRAPEALQRRMAELEEETAANEPAGPLDRFDYGGRGEIVEAARRIVATASRRTRSTRSSSPPTSTRPSCPSRTS